MRDFLWIFVLKDLFPNGKRPIPFLSLIDVGKLNLSLISVSVISLENKLWVNSLVILKRGDHNVVRLFNISLNGLFESKFESLEIFSG